MNSVTSSVGTESARVVGCENLSKAYGGVQAVRSVSIDVRSTGVYGLCGFNGAGKSTLFDLLAGATPADSGTVWLGDDDVTGQPAVLRARMGLARTWQQVRLAMDRTVLDNVAVGALTNKSQSILGSFFRPQIAPARAKAAEVLASLGLTSLSERHAGDLTLEGQRLTELARALSGDARLILADEPASGLSTAQRTVLADVLTQIGADRTVILVEHDIDLLMSISKYVWAMVSGEIAYEGSIEDFRASQVYSDLRGLHIEEG
jgi:ABC-type branched-subunit amino acid transport system ATPase component